MGVPAVIGASNSVGTPSPPTIPPPPLYAHPATLGSASVIEAGQVQQNRAKVAEGKGLNNTIATSSQGAPSPQTAKTYLS